MTRSLPGAPDRSLSAVRAPIRFSPRLQSTAAALGLKAIPWLPTGVKRVLVGGRSITIDGNTLDPTLQLMLAGQRRLGINGLCVGDDVARSRSQLRKLCGAFGGPQIHVGVSDLSIPGPAGDIPARHYRPASSGPAPLLVFFHGGGWVIGDLDSYDALCRLICRDAAIHVLAIDYRLAPEHPAPAGLDDAYAAFHWAYEHAAELGATPGKVAIGGDSAGGNFGNGGVANDSCRRRSGAGAAVAHLPAHGLHGTHTIPHAVRRRVLADQTRHRLVRCELLD